MPQENLPDPSGGPEPVHPVGELLQLLSYAAAALVGGGIISAAFVTPVMGATRSAQLRWEDRQHQMERAADTFQDQRRGGTHATGKSSRSVR